MRRTVHPLTADDVLAWRSRHDSMLLQRVLDTYHRELAEEADRLTKFLT
jgi:iron-sulfur cluster repair protein YtfE (RIC family)